MEQGINIFNEKSLHSQIKTWYSIPGDKIEHKVDDYIIDIHRENLLIEVQTKNFAAISGKLRTLLNNHCIRLIYPIAIEKYITLTNSQGTVIRRRKSPKKGQVSDLFKELVRIPDLILNKNFSIEVLFISEEEIRCDDGNGSWRRKGISIKDRILLQVISNRIFHEAEDFLEILCLDVTIPFTNKMLSKSMKIPISVSQKITYCLRKMDILEIHSKNKNELIFIKSTQNII